jgi:hypothetical protein
VGTQSRSAGVQWLRRLRIIIQIASAICVCFAVVSVARILISGLKDSLLGIAVVLATAFLASCSLSILAFVVVRFLEDVVEVLTNPEQQEQ